MNWKKTTAAVVPCYNEEATIKQLLHGIGKHLKTIFVVDDGSGDSTASEALAGGGLVLRHEQNRGKGAALHTGLCAASERGFSWAVLLDGDGQHCPADIPRLFSCAEMTGAQLVIGDRLRERGSMSWLRRIVNFWM
ncbi:MAG TPA: glycosyltransferase family 2 protein, partial [Candidatus Dormibacteraeota bacterium]|nr:glycosyltransferase family 2 protein [Candidatus Dormibacteraeota bacterium]